MLTGKRYKVLESIAALDGVDKRGWISIPPGVIIEVVNGPDGNGDRLIEILWEGRELSMFSGDLSCCVELPFRKKAIA